MLYQVKGALSQILTEIYMCIIKNLKIMLHSYYQLLTSPFGCGWLGWKWQQLGKLG